MLSVAEAAQLCVWPLVGDEQWEEREGRNWRGRRRDSGGSGQAGRKRRRRDRGRSSLGRTGALLPVWWWFHVEEEESDWESSEVVTLKRILFIVHPQNVYPVLYLAGEEQYSDLLLFLLLLFNGWRLWAIQWSVAMERYARSTVELTVSTDIGSH